MNGLTGSSSDIVWSPLMTWENFFIGQKARKSLGLFPFSKNMQWVMLFLLPQIDYYAFVVTVTGMTIADKINGTSGPPLPPFSMIPKWFVLLLCIFIIALGG